MEKKIDGKKVSIIVPVYNVKDQIKRCLDSIGDQTYKNYECILVDDGSTDGSGEICDLYEKKDNRFIVIHQNNAGLSVARNTAMSVANGEYVSFVDSDDYILPCYLEKMVDILEKRQCDIVKCDYYKGVYEEEKVIFTPEIELFTGREFTEILLTDKIGSQLWQYLFKKTLWKDITSPAGRYAQDMMILHEVTDRASRIAVLHEKLYFYYIDRSNSTSNAYSKKVKGAFDRAIAFKERYEFAVKRKYEKCLNGLMIHVLDFYNNAEVLKQRIIDDPNSFLEDEYELSLFLKKNRSARGIKTIGFKYWIIGICLSYFPKMYSKIRGGK